MDQQHIPRPQQVRLTTICFSFRGHLQNIRLLNLLYSVLDFLNRAPPPPIQQKLEWFRYWDEDGSGELDQEEAIRALAKTFQLAHNLARIQVKDTL